MLFGNGGDYLFSASGKMVDRSINATYFVGRRVVDGELADKKPEVWSLAFHWHNSFVGASKVSASGLDYVWSLVNNGWTDSYMGLKSLIN